MKTIFYSVVKHLLGILGVAVGRIDPGSVRHTLRGALEHGKKLGFTPEVIIDVGAARGTVELYETFPDVRHIMIEPLEENRPYLDKIVRGLKNAEYIMAAATKSSGIVTLNVHPDFDGSSLYLEDEEGDVNGIPRMVKAVTLDDLYREQGVKGATLIKIDVQGAELDVLQGASEVLKNTEYIILEATLFKFFDRAPQFSDIIFFMKERGFVVYDILDYGYRLLDGAMSQVDLVFVKEDGMFRIYHFYATKEQRDAQNKAFVKNAYGHGMNDD